MPLVIDTNTLLPMGFVITILGGVGWFSRKMSMTDLTLKEIQGFMAEAKKNAIETLRRADFEKHIAEDAAFHLGFEKRMTDLERLQDRMDEKLGSIERTVIIIQADVKKVLEK